MIGYGAKKIKVVWPNNAKLALQIVLNYEEGAENSILHGDKHSETFLSERSFPIPISHILQTCTIRNVYVKKAPAIIVSAEL